MFNMAAKNFYCGTYIWIISSHYFYITNAAKFTRCEFGLELSKQLTKEDFEKELGDWLCIAETNSSLDTSFSLQSPSSPIGRNYGIFQISNGFWCLDENTKTRNPNFENPCRIKCTELLDDDLSNDISCAIKIKAIHGFSGWATWTNVCNGRNLDQFRYLDNCSVTPQPTTPSILNKTVSTNITFVDGVKDQYLYCYGTGTPLPVLNWDYDRNEFPDLIPQQLPSEDKGISVTRLIFPMVNKTYSGVYTCIANNFYGHDFKSYYVNVKGGATPDSSSHVQYVLLIGLPLVILIIALITALIYFRKVFNKLNGLTDSEIHEFNYGCKEKLKSNGLAHENVAHLPYNRDYEISKDKLKMAEGSQSLGEGQYGLVTKAMLNGLTVAVKSIKPNTDKLYIKALLSELKIMIHLGVHENIVSLVGAVTNELNKGLLLIVVEFCELGDLQNYLRAHKDRYMQESSLIEPPDLQVSNDYQNTNLITNKSLLRWCEQIANGMAYLGSKRVVHGDLAARNVLLTSNCTIKITDFGLSRQLYDYLNYVKKQQAPLPWRHMALESLQEMSFSPESDVWSYGVTMWEIFSLGDVPYPGRSWSLEFVHELESGLRLLQPKYASDKIYEVMKACWNQNKYQRPTFSSLTQLLDD